MVSAAEVHLDEREKQADRIENLSYEDRVKVLPFSSSSLLLSSLELSDTQSL